jgi:hypothetical protein
MVLNWLPLTEYSSKYQVSISTLRRRIKAEDIKYQFADGRYLILDQPQEHRPSPAMSPSLKKPPVEQSPVGASTHLDQVPIQAAQTTQDEPILTAANRLLTELKKAYTQILQEKEEQILHLKEEQADLKTLIRVLEAENDRLSNQLKQNSPA